MSPLVAANPAPPFDVVRVSHVELGVADLQRSRAFYEEALGLVVSAAEPGALYLRGLEEAAPFSLELRDDPLLKPDEFKLVVKAAGRDVTNQYAVA